MKNIKLFLLLVFAISISVAQAQNRSINFEHGTWKEIKDKAKQENKLIFIDCITSWCGPCKVMAKNVFTNDTVADYFNQHFICAKIDMEVGEGKELAKKFIVNIYPSFIFADAQGNMVHRFAGGMPANEFLQLSKDALSPNAYSSLVKKYESGIRDTKFMTEYLKATSSACLDTKIPLSAYFSTQKESDLINRENWNLIYDYLNDINSRQFKYLLANISAFEQKYTSDSVSAVINKSYGDACYGIIYNPKSDKKKYLALKEEIKKVNFNGSEKLLLNTDLSYYQSQSDWKNYISTSDILITKYLPSEDKEEQISILNNICWTCFENVTDKQSLAKAVEWGKKSMETEDPAFIDTYANLLFKSGNKSEAVIAEEKVIELLKKNPDASFPVAEAESTLATFKK